MTDEQDREISLSDMTLYTAALTVMGVKGLLMYCEQVGRPAPDPETIAWAMIHGGYAMLSENEDDDSEFARDNREIRNRIIATMAMLSKPLSESVN